MQALDTLAAVYAVFEKAGANPDVENSEGDILSAHVRAAMEEFNEAQQNQERMRGVLQDSQESLDNAFVECKEACRGLEEASNEDYRNKKESRRCPRPNQDSQGSMPLCVGGVRECRVPGPHGAAHTRHCGGNTRVVMRHHES